MVDPTRRELLEAAGAAFLAAAMAPMVGCRAPDESEAAVEPEIEPDPPPRPADRMPVLFVGHGSPMNAIEDNTWSRAFQTLGRELPRPTAVLAVSAHWWTGGTFLTGGTRPRTIHDFRGFPPELFEIRYPAPGSPDLATRVRQLLAERTTPPAAVKDDWGLDHGSWSVLRHLIPVADVPVVQLSLDGRLTAREHFELGRSLHQLRGEGILVLGSGNVTHNLHDAMTRISTPDPATPEWARRFDREVAQAIRERDESHLVEAWPDGEDARQVHPHPDHWFPLLYAYAASDAKDEVTFPVEGFDLGSLSMRAVRWG